MTGRTIRIARIAGIPVGISPLWLVIVALITWSLAVGYYPDRVEGISSGGAYLLGFASALLLFASVLAHEFGHALVARGRGVEVEEIDLWLLGGVAKMGDNPHEAGDELRFAIAGPLVTLCVAAGFGALALGLPSSAPESLRALVTYQAEVNLLILGFNLLPAFPLDGGRVARSLIWLRTGDRRRATSIASMLGRGFGYSLIGLGLLGVLNGLPGGLWFVIIGFFLAAAARAELAEEEIEETFQGVRARELMSAPAISLPADLTLAQAVQDHVGRHRFTAFPVIDPGGRVEGLLSLDAIARTPPAQRGVRSTGEASDRDPGLVIREDEDVTALLHRPAFIRTGRAVVVDPAQRPVGMVSVTDVQRAVRAAQLGAGT
jgi:Zn-dependent protease